MLVGAARQVVMHGHIRAPGGEVNPQLRLYRARVIEQIAAVLAELRARFLPVADRPFPDDDAAGIGR
jgi:hypothetical protein